MRACTRLPDNYRVNECGGSDEIPKFGVKKLKQSIAQRDVGATIAQELSSC